MNGQTATTTLTVNVNNGGASGGGGSGQPTIDLNVTDRTPKSGETTRIDLTVANPGDAVVVDAYLGVVVPPAVAATYGCSGEGLAFLVQGSPTFTIRCRSWSPATYPAYAKNVTVPAGLPPTQLPGLFNVAWPTAPAGTYTVFLALTVPGSAADGRTDPGDIVVQATQTITLSP